MWASNAKDELSAKMFTEWRPEGVLQQIFPENPCTRDFEDETYCREHKYIYKIGGRERPV